MNEQITKALRAVGYPVTELPDGWVVNGEANPVLESLLAHGAQVDGIVTDPPWMSVATAYPIDLKAAAKGTHKKSGRQWSDMLTLKMAFEGNFSLLRSVQRDGGAAAIFCGGAATAMYYELCYNLWKQLHLVVWEKGAGRVKLPFNYALEFILFCCDEHIYKVPPDIDSKALPPIIKCKSVHRKQRIHPAEKPVELLELFVKLTTPPGGVVLDCFAGSFSTMRAARNVGRRFLCIEADKEFYERGVGLAQKEGTRRTLFA